MKKLVSDERGAIMMLGLGAALVLIGAMWFLMGIADTLVWRDKMQEAVDSAAFSSATIHARGMNFIAAMNLVMLALVTLHVAIGIIADIVTIAGAICVLPPGVFVCGAAAPTIFNGARQVRNAQEAYDRFMWPALGVLNAAQTATAVTAPWLGSVAALENGNDYKTTTFAFGPSNVPFGVGATPTENVPFPDANVRLGLPVSFEPMNAMCKRPVAWVMDWGKSKAESSPIVKQIIDALPFKSVVQKIINEIVTRVNRYLGDGLAFFECPSTSQDDDLGGLLAKFRAAAQPFVPLGAKPDERWGKHGGKQMWFFGRNGQQWMQVWAWTTGASKVDDEERKVGIARNEYGDIGTTSVKGTYFAQAELYYDCGGPHAWGTIHCNGMGALGSHFAVYNMRWRARLTRFHRVGIEQMLLQTSSATLDYLGWLDQVVAKIPLAGRPDGTLTFPGSLAKLHLYEALFAVSKATDPKPNDEILH